MASLAAASGAEAATALEEDAAAAGAAAGPGGAEGASRAAGNLLFGQREYDAAITVYGVALEKEAAKGERALLYSNRSACFAAVGDLVSACEDAAAAIKESPRLAKAWYRLASAEYRRRRGAESLRAAKRGLALEDSSDMRALVAKCKQLYAKQKPKASLYGDKRAAPKKTATAVELEARDGQLALERLRSMAREAVDRPATAPRADGMMVYFDKLARSPADFREVVFPGVPPSRFAATAAGDGEDEALPGTLKAFLDDPRYAWALEKRWPAVLKKAYGVLNGAKRQGAAAGETMDEETERALWPQIVCEAYARDFHAAAHEATVAKRDAALRASGARAPDRAAPPPETSYALPGRVPKALSLHADPKQWTGVACVVQDFLGADWAALVDDDAARLCDESDDATDRARERRLTPLLAELGPGRADVAEPRDAGSAKGNFRKRGSVAWLDAAELDSDFPALAELKRKLNEVGAALAHAATALDGPEGRVQPLLAPAAPSEVEACDALAPPTEASMLFKIDVDDDVDDEDLACDGDDPTANDDHFPLVSCLYFLGTGDAKAHLDDKAEKKKKQPAKAGGDDDGSPGLNRGYLILKRVPDGDFAYVPPKPDTLVLWRSKLAYHAREPVKSAASLAVKHWVFAAKAPP